MNEKSIRIGLIREGKQPADKRVAFSPEQCKLIQQKFPQVSMYVQPSESRCFSDAEYVAQGIEMQEDLSDCDILMGIKEVPIDQLMANKTYLFFSHTIKKQPHNRKLLRAIIQKNIRLIDYETLVWENGSRVLGFGRFAGIVGAHNGFLAYGKKTKAFDLKPAYQCKDYAEMVNQYQHIQLPPIKIVLCGDGRVGHGCLEMLEKIGVSEVTPQEFLNKNFEYPVYVHLVSEDYYKHKAGIPWDKADFYHNPENYVSTFEPYTQEADLMMNAIFWHEKIPRFFTLEDMKSPNFKLKVIADISCDINGSIPATVKDTSIENPVFGYHPIAETIVEPYLPNTIDIMAVSNLPCELPVDASISFGEQLIRHVMGHFIYEKPNDMLARATLAQDGQLTTKFSYLSDYID